MQEPLDHTAQLDGLLDLMRSGDQTARQRLVEHACERLRGLARKMLRRYPKVHRWEETDDVFVEAVTRLHRALATVQPESPRHFYNLAATQIRRVLIDLARRYCGPEGLGSRHDTAARSPDGESPPRYERADSSGEPSNLAEWTEFHEQVEVLPEEEREVFNLALVRADDARGGSRGAGRDGEDRPPTMAGRTLPAPEGSPRRTVAR